MIRKLKFIGLLLAGGLVIVTTTGIGGDDIRQMEEVNEIVERALFEAETAEAGVNSTHTSTTYPHIVVISLGYLFRAKIISFDHSVNTRSYISLIVLK